MRIGRRGSEEEEEGAFFVLSVEKVDDGGICRSSASEDRRWRGRGSVTRSSGPEDRRISPHLRRTPPSSKKSPPPPSFVPSSDESPGSKIKEAGFFVLRLRRSKIQSGILRCSAPKIEDGGFSVFRYRSSKGGGSSKRQASSKMGGSSKIRVSSKMKVSSICLIRRTKNLTPHLRSSERRWGRRSPSTPRVPGAKALSVPDESGKKWYHQCVV